MHDKLFLPVIHILENYSNPFIHNKHNRKDMISFLIVNYILIKDDI